MFSEKAIERSTLPEHVSELWPTGPGRIHAFVFAYQINLLCKNKKAAQRFNSRSGLLLF